MRRLHPDLAPDPDSEDSPEQNGTQRSRPPGDDVGMREPDRLCWFCKTSTSTVAILDSPR